jgi:hypothetical protein
VSGLEHILKIRLIHSILILNCFLLIWAEAGGQTYQAGIDRWVPQDALDALEVKAVSQIHESSTVILIGLSLIILSGTLRYKVITEVN